MKLPFEIPDSLSAPSWLHRVSWRVLAMAGGSLALLAVVIAGAWFWSAAEQRRGLESFATAMVRLQLSQAPSASPEAKAEAVRDLEATLGKKTSAIVSSQVTYELANFKYAAKQYPASRSAYELTAAGPAPTLDRLAQVSLGYTWEAEKNYAKAVGAFTDALKGLKAGDFLFDELMMDLARNQELAGRRDDAVKTYERIAGDPKSLRSDDARARLASLAAQRP